MTSLSYLELLKSKQAKLLEVLNLYESGVGKRSDFVNKTLCGSENVSFNNSENAVLKLSLMKDVKLECLNKSLILLGDSLCSAPDSGYKHRYSKLMTRHELDHQRDEKPFKCDDCMFATNRKDSLKEHRVRIHSKSTECKKVFICEFDGCNFRTTRNSHAVLHRRRHLKIKPFKCDHPNCNVSCASRSELQSHEMVHTNGTNKKLFRCMQNSCKFATKHQFYLKVHQATHSSVRAFKCSHKDCTYSAKLKDTLRRHLLSHSGAKPYKCDFNGCNYASNRKWHLKSHRVVHSEVRPFKCDYNNCNFSSKHKSALKNHFSLHTNFKT